MPALKGVLVPDIVCPAQSRVMLLLLMRSPMSEHGPTSPESVVSEKRSLPHAGSAKAAGGSITNADIRRTEITAMVRMFIIFEFLVFTDEHTSLILIL